MRVVASLILTMSLLILNISGCSIGNGSQNGDSSRQLSDTLRVATLYSPTSYFIYRDAMLGFDYSLVSEFAKDNNIAIDLIVAPNMENMINMLENGDVDLVAYEIPITSDYKDRVLHCGMVNNNYQVLVQPKQGDSVAIKDVRIDLRTSALV